MPELDQEEHQRTLHGPRVPIAPRCVGQTEMGRRRVAGSRHGLRPLRVPVDPSARVVEHSTGWVVASGLAARAKAESRIEQASLPLRFADSGLGGCNASGQRADAVWPRMRA